MIGAIAALLALIAGAYSAKTIQRSPQTSTAAALSPEVSTQLFATRMPDAHGTQQSFSQWKGKTLVLNFWATWCPPCREEMPAFSRLQSKYADKNVQFVGISIDFADNVKKFAQQFGATYPLLIGDTTGADLGIMLGNSKQALPYTLVLGPNSELLLQQLGQVPEAELDALLHKATEGQ